MDKERRLVGITMTTVWIITVRIVQKIIISHNAVTCSVSGHIICGTGSSVLHAGTGLQGLLQDVMGGVVAT